MELLNRIKDIKTEGDKVLKLQMEKLMYSYLIQALYPVAPHLTSEIWEQLGHQRELTDLPDFKELLESLNDSEKFSIQINGKFIQHFEMPVTYKGDA